jgi:hypothetical protein
MLKMYAPNLSEATLSKLVSAFGQLRKLSDQGLISYPYSTREIVNIVKHLEKFPEDSLSNVLANVYDFDHFAEQSDLKNTFKEIMRKHGIPIEASSFQINMAKTVQMPGILPMQKINIKLLEQNDMSYSISSIMNLNWSKLGELEHEININKFKVEKHESRVESFSELRSVWSLANRQQIITDLLVVKNNQNLDLIYMTGIKPLSIVQLNTNKNEAIELNLSNFFRFAWKLYFPRVKLLPIENEFNKVLMYEENSNELYKIDFDSFSLYKLEKNLHESSSNALHLVNKAKKTINKYFVDQSQSNKMIANNNGIFISYKSNTNNLVFDYLQENKEINLNLNNVLDNMKLGINQVTLLNSSSVLISGYDQIKIINSDDLSPKDLKYFIINFPSRLGDYDLNQLNDQIKLYSIDKNILGYEDDLIVSDVSLKSFNDNMNQQTSNLLKVSVLFNLSNLITF